MRYLAKNKKIEDLLPLIKGQNAKVFYVDSDTKVTLSVHKKCFICSKWYGNKDIIKTQKNDVITNICFWCSEEADRLVEANERGEGNET